MLPTIHFNDQTRGYAREVGEVWWDRVLAPEAHAESVVPQHAPQRTLGLGRVIAKSSCGCVVLTAGHGAIVPRASMLPTVLLLSFLEAQSRPHPNPPPQGGGGGRARPAARHTA